MNIVFRDIFLALVHSVHLYYLKIINRSFSTGLVPFTITVDIIMYQ